MSKGRGNGNSVTTGEALRININDLYKSKLIQQGNRIESVYNWSNGSKINLTTVSSKNETYIQLNYNSEGKKFDYKIYIVSVPSNLGKGFNRYFICPKSAKRCKIVYLCYGSEWFKCRQAYSTRIYYHLQKQSKVSCFNERVFNYEGKLEKLDLLRNQNTYKGKPTKRRLRTIKLYNKKAKADKLQAEQIYKWLDKFTGYKAV